MPGGLPEGIISVQLPPDTPPVDSDEGDHNGLVWLEDLVLSWQVYAKATRAGQQISSKRLENLFWRLLSNPFLHQSITSTTITRLVFRFGLEQDLIVAPPTRRPDATAGASHGDATPTPSSPHVQNHPPPHSVQEPSTSNTDSQLALSPPRPLPSILKKPRTTSLESDISPGTGMTPSESMANYSRGESSSSAISRPSLAEAQGPRNRKSSDGKKRSSVVMASGGRAKARPAMGRRKSSQTSEQPKSPKLPQRVLMDASAPKEPSTRLSPPALGVVRQPTSVFELPSASSWQSDESASPTRTSPRPPSVSFHSPAELVDPGFRGKFVENLRRSGSYTSLAATGRLSKSGSVVRFADQLVEPVDKGKGKLRLASVSDDAERAGNCDGLDVPSSRENSEALIDESDDSEDGPHLPRTRSQLSLLIQRERKLSESGDLGTSMPDGESEDKGKGPAKAKMSQDKKAEEELLEMGRRDGVTRAGGMRRGQQRLSGKSGSEERYRSPTPPPLFG